MTVGEKQMRQSLRVAGILLILGLAVEAISLAWEKPLAFLLFAFVGGTLLFLGILLYLYSLVSNTPSSPRAEREKPS